MGDCAAVVVAAGRGTRFGGVVPKQFVSLCGIPVLAWSLRFFDRQPSVDHLVIAVHAGLEERAAALCDDSGLAKPFRVVTGGALRQDSVHLGMAGILSTTEFVAVHDAARPFPPEDFEDVLAQAREHGGVIYGEPVRETIKRVKERVVVGTVDRSRLWAVQTPQVFRRELLARALDHCIERQIEVTDEAAAVERIGEQVLVAPAPGTNIKITTPGDWIIAEAIAASLLRRPPGNEGNDG
jgi:2-C-methyl-D-erythritol 4-phosphate cytidylyltransferase